MTTHAGLLETGRLDRAGAPGAGAVYEMRFLSEADAPAVLRLQDDALAALPRPDLYEKYAAAAARECLNGPGGGIGVFVQERMIAFRLNHVPGSADDNLGHDLQLGADHLGHVAHLERAVVHPDFRGHRLQLRMIRHALERFRALGLHHVCSTVSPWNFASALNMLDGGLRIKGLQQKYGQKWRWIFHRNLSDAGTPGAKNRMWVSNSDVELQMRLLAEGWVGIEIRKNAGGVQVACVHPLRDAAPGIEA